MVVTFDYDALKDAQSYMRKLDGHFDELKSYGRDLKSSINNSLNEVFLAGSDPYGWGYVESAKGSIEKKNTLLEADADAWSSRATKLNNFMDFVEKRDEKVATDLSTLMYEYVDFSLLGFASFAYDSVINFFTIDLANSCEVTREIMEWAKEKKDDLDAVLQDVEDWFQHGDGKYVLNIIGAIAGAVGAIAGAVAGIVAAPFSGGASLAATVACIGAIAAGIAAAMTAFNAIFEVQQNVKALGTEDVAESRFYGNIDGFHEYIKRTDMGNAKENAAWEKVGEIYDDVHAKAEITSVVCGGLTSFGTKETIVDGKKVLEYDFSKKNVLNNVKKSLGIKIEKVDEIDIHVGNVDAVELVDGTPEMMVFKGETDIKTAGIMKTTSDDAIKVSMGKMSSHSEYQGVVLSDGVISGTHLEYASVSKSSSISVDIELSNTAKKVKSQNATDNLIRWFGAKEAPIKQKQLYNLVSDAKDLSDKVELGIDLIRKDGDDLGIVAYSKFTDTKFGKFVTDYIIDYEFEEGIYNKDHFIIPDKPKDLWEGIKKDFVNDSRRDHYEFMFGNYEEIVKEAW